jgi:hypothetical protein
MDRELSMGSFFAYAAADVGRRLRWDKGSRWVIGIFFSL